MHTQSRSKNSVQNPCVLLERQKRNLNVAQGYITVDLRWKGYIHKCCIPTGLITQRDFVLFDLLLTEIKLKIYLRDMKLVY